MTQDTRKDPRAKVLTMTVRYKSATLDEFIEHHSHDVSRGGMFIKTPSPFPAGTLLKFEVKIAAEQRVMQGVGRVVWKREASESNDARPAGMGVKFIKIDDESRKVIDQLVVARGEAQSAFEQGSAEAPPPARGSVPDDAPKPATAVAAPLASTGPSGRKATMIGLGALGSATPPPPPAAPSNEEAFFPKTELDLPPPEDRTVMKQAAELLQDALREAGGSLEDVGTPAAPASKSADAAKSSATKAGDSAAHAAGAAAAVSSRDAEPAPVSQKPAPISEKPAPASVKPAPAPEKPKVEAKPDAKSVVVTQPARRPSAQSPLAATQASQRRVAAAAKPAPAPMTESGGSGRLLVAIAAVAVVGGIIYFATRPEAPSETPAPAAAEAPAPPPAATPAAVPSAAATRAVPPPAPEAPPAASAEPRTSPPPATSSEHLAASAHAAPPAASASSKPKPAAHAKPKPAEPATAAQTSPSEPATPPPAAPPPSEPAAPAPKAVEPPKPVEAPTAAPAPKPAAPKPAAAKPAAPKPAPKPAAPSGDNPY